MRDPECMKSQIEWKYMKKVGKSSKMLKFWNNDEIDVKKLNKCEYLWTFGRARFARNPSQDFAFFRPLANILIKKKGSGIFRGFLRFFFDFWSILGVYFQSENWMKRNKSWCKLWINRGISDEWWQIEWFFGGIFNEIS